jgi:signal transduction histidine kinase/ActR/RegA family two-component response regulator
LQDAVDSLSQPRAESVIVEGSEVLRAQLRADSGHRMLATGIVLMAVIGFIAVVPFVRTHLTAVPAFIPAYESALALSELLTAVLLFLQHHRTGVPRLRILAAGYLFSFMMIIPHELTYPGVFTATGLLGATDQSTAWLYIFWHAGFPLFVLGYVFNSRERTEGQAPQMQLRDYLLTFGAVLALCTALTWLCTGGVTSLPVIMRGGDYSLLVSTGVSPVVLVLYFLALLAVWRESRGTTLDVWMLTAMAVGILDIALSSVLGSARFDLGWYVGRCFGWIGGTVILMLLLWENNQIYALLAASIDVAARKLTEANESRTALARAQRLDAMGQLTGGVAHDFNNVLQVISLNLHILKMKYGELDGVQQGLARALDSVQKGARLSTSLLSFARKQPLRPEATDIGRVLKEMDDVLRPTLGGEFEIETVISGGLWPALIDPALLENALLNLALNARDAMEGGGRLTIEASNASLSEQYAIEQGGDVLAGQYIVIAVSDTGSGISPDVLDRMFEPFFTTKAVDKGTGLGLSMVYGFVKQSSGHIKVYTELEHGTTVKLYLPRATGSLKAAKPLYLDAESGFETILVVEDDPAVREGAVALVEAFGYRVLSAASAAEAFEVVESGAHIDLVFTDVIMPGPLKTTDMVARIKERHPNMPVVYTSGYTENAIVHNGKLDRGVDLISKPYNPDELSLKLRQALDRPKKRSSSTDFGQTSEA